MSGKALSVTPQLALDDRHIIVRLAQNALVTGLLGMANRLAIIPQSPLEIATITMNVSEPVKHAPKRPGIVETTSKRFGPGTHLESRGKLSQTGMSKKKFQRQA